MKEIALGVNRKNLKPYNTMILCSSGSERRLLEQYLRIAGFKITGAEEKIIQLHNTKRDLAESLLEGSDQSARMSLNELVSLIQESL